MNWQFQVLLDTVASSYMVINEICMIHSWFYETADYLWLSGCHTKNYECMKRERERQRERGGGGVGEETERDTHTHTKRETDRQRQSLSQRERETERERERERNTHTHTHRKTEREYTDTCSGFAGSFISFIKTDGLSSGNQSLQSN